MSDAPWVKPTVANDLPTSCSVSSSLTGASHLNKPHMQKLWQAADQMGRFDRFGPNSNSNGFVTPEEQERRLLQHNKRKARPGQLPPSNRASGRRRKGSPDEDHQHNRAAGQKAAPSQEWRERQQKVQQQWSEQRENNRSLAVQYHAFLSQGLQLLQLDHAMSVAATAVAQGAVLHPCCNLALDEASAVVPLLCQQLLSLQQQLQSQRQQQQQQQQQQGPGPGQPNPSQQAGQQHERQQQQQAMLSVVSTRSVAMHTLGTSFWFPVPTMKCSHCSQMWEVEPAAAGFFGSSPTQPHAWFSSQLLNTYTSLSTSGTSFLSMATAMDRNSVRQQGEGLSIQPKQLSGAWLEWRSVSQALGAAGIAGSLAGAALGPAVYCPACAVVDAADDSSADRSAAATSHAGSSVNSRHTASSCVAGDAELEEQAKQFGLLPGDVSVALVGPAGRPVIPVACFDANAKANRYQNAGKASSTSFEQLPPGRFFGQAHLDVWQLQAKGGALPLSSTGTSGIGGSTGSGSGADDADLELETAIQDDCHPHLTCARHTSQCSSISDVCGIAAGVCAHGQPLAGCALAMPAPERFLYYDLLVSHMQKDADIRLMYIDTGCSFASHMRLHMPPDAAPADIKVPWWHARGHGASCFLKNSGLYMPGSGRRVGENCEQLWAQLRPVTKHTRYMSKDNYVFVLDDALLLIAGDKLGSFVAFMRDQEQALKKKLALTHTHISNSIRTAAGLGFNQKQLLQAAVATMQAVTAPNDDGNESPDERRRRLLAEYVRCSEEESVLCTLQGRRSAVAVALPGTERQLQSQAQHDKRVAKLQDRMAVLQVELGWREPLSEGSAEYQQGLSLLRDQQLRHLQQQVEREAAALGEITQMRRGMGESCQQTKNQEKKAQRRRSRIRQLIDTMWAWQQKDLPGSTVTQQLPEQWTEQAIKDLFCGNFPWQQTQGGAGQLPSLLVESFRDACAEQARTLEEEVILRVEQQRTVSYFQHLSSLAAAAAADMQAQHSELAENLPQVLHDAGGTVAAGSLKEYGQQMGQLYAQHLLHEEWSQTFGSWAEQAQAVLQQS